MAAPKTIVNKIQAKSGVLMLFSSLFKPLRSYFVTFTRYFVYVANADRQTFNQISMLCLSDCLFHSDVSSFTLRLE